MKQIFCLLLLLTLLLSLGACGNDAVASSITTEATTQVPTTQIPVPEPPSAQDYLTELWDTYTCTQTDVTVSGLQAEYTVETSLAAQIVDCTGTYKLILEYDPTAQTWNTVESKWVQKSHLFDLDFLLENNVWVVTPDAESQSITLTLDQIVTGRCRIRWDGAPAVNGSAAGEAYCTYKLGHLGSNTGTPCWLVQGLEITCGEETCYLQIRPDSICLVREPFGEEAVGTVTFVQEDTL